MATTVNNSTLTTTTSDSLILNGVTYGNSTTKTNSNSDEVYNRIMTIPAFEENATTGTMIQDFVSIVSATQAPNSAGDVEFDKFQYARFTNLDDTYPIWIKITDTNKIANIRAASVFQVPAGSSYIMHSPIFFASNANIDGQDVDGKNTNLNREFAIYALADENSGTAGCDIEVFVVTK